MKKYLHIKYDIMSVIVKPAAAAAVMFGVIGYLKGILPPLSPMIEMLCLCISGGAAYICTLLLTGAVKKQELEKVL